MNRLFQGTWANCLLSSGNNVLIPVSQSCSCKGMGRELKQKSPLTPKKKSDSENIWSVLEHPRSQACWSLMNRGRAKERRVRAFAQRQNIAATARCLQLVPCAHPRPWARRSSVPADASGASARGLTARSSLQTSHLCCRQRLLRGNGAETRILFLYSQGN